jgi:hypothetical protein
MSSKKTIRPKTLNRGADDERACWIRKLRALDQDQHRYSDAKLNGDEILEMLLEWGALRVARNKRKGGLGKK